MENIYNLKESIFEEILKHIQPLNFKRVVEQYGHNDKVLINHYQIITIDEIFKAAHLATKDIIRIDESIFIYNGEYWKKIHPEMFKEFMKQIALTLGVPYLIAKHHTFLSGLYQQLVASVKHMVKEPNETVSINLKNGTFRFFSEGCKFTAFDQNDYFTYQLPFGFDADAKSPLFDLYLNRVLPDINVQHVLAEFIGYLFIKTIKT